MHDASSSDEHDTLAGIKKVRYESENEEIRLACYLHAMFCRSKVRDLIVHLMFEF